MVVALKGVSPSTKGRANWVGVELPPGCTEAEARQRIFNAPLNAAMRKLAERVGIVPGDLPFGAVWPEIKIHRTAVEEDLIKHAGWEPGKFLGWEDSVFLIVEIGLDTATSRHKIRLRALGVPQLHEVRVKKGTSKTTQVKGVLVPLSRKARTVFPIDIIDAKIQPASDLKLY